MYWCGLKVVYRLTSGRPFPCIFSSILQSGPKALPLYLPAERVELSFRLSNIPIMNYQHLLLRIITNSNIDCVL